MQTSWSLTITLFLNLDSLPVDHTHRKVIFNKSKIGYFSTNSREKKGKECDNLLALYNIWQPPKTLANKGKITTKIWIPNKAQDWIILFPICCQQRNREGRQRKGKRWRTDLKRVIYPLLQVVWLLVSYWSWQNKSLQLFSRQASNNLSLSKNIPLQWKNQDQ